MKITEVLTVSRKIIKKLVRLHISYIVDNTKYSDLHAFMLTIETYNNTGQGTPEALSSFMEVYSERFAELIVEECAGIADALYLRRIPSGQHILEHFGVEE